MGNIIDLLPKYNCGKCGYKQCRDFASALHENKTHPGKCPHINPLKINEIINSIKDHSKDIIGLIDGLQADFTLIPLFGEPSCREQLYPFNQKITLSTDSYIRYRPLGCPLIHFAKVLSIKDGILTVHLVGPINKFQKNNIKIENIGICMVAAFQGIVGRGKMPSVGQTVKFLPENCMMQKVHSGIVIHTEGKMVRIEAIDLKIW